MVEMRMEVVGGVKLCVLRVPLHATCGGGCVWVALYDEPELMPEGTNTIVTIA